MSSRDCEIEYPSWSEAAAASGNWGCPAILAKVRAAVLKLLQGSHNYERDGTAFERRPAKYTLREIIKKVWRPGDLIIDFGGGLGGTYLNNADVLEEDDLSYIIIEQNSFCDEGLLIAQEFGLPLTFHTSLAEANIPKHPRILIFSGVLHYIEHWSDIVRQALLLKPEHVIIDRIPIALNRERFFSCHLSDYYQSPVSYPMQTVNEQRLLSEFDGYSLVAEWPSDFDPDDNNPKGYHFVKNCKS
jgi:putative methyltransferase (TIGR04325 family)